MDVDGTKMYMLGFNGNTVDQYSLSTAFSPSSGSYDSKSKSIASEDTDVSGLFFSPDGTKMYVAGYQSDEVYQYTLSTPWDVSSASYASKSADVSSEDTECSGLFFSPDGTKMYVSGNSNDTIYQYTLSTPWDVSTASYASKSLDVSTQCAGTGGIWFKTDGSKVYVIDLVDCEVYQYTLSTPWDISTGSYDSKLYDTTTESIDTALGVAFNEDGSKMFVTAFDSQEVNRYTLSTPWDVSTASADSNAFDFSSQDTQPRAVFFGVSKSFVPRMMVF